MKKLKEKEKQRKIALERIKILFEEADKIFKVDKKLADKYVKLARKLGMKVNLKWPRELKRRYCKHCYCFLKPGVNCRIRNKDKKMVYYCLECKKYMRFPLKNKKKN